MAKKVCDKNILNDNFDNNSKIDFLFVYEHPERELESIMLIGETLIKRGFRVVYYYRTSDIIFPREYFGNVRVIVVPFLYSEVDLYEVIYRIAGKVDAIVDLRWEQIYKKSVEADDNAFWYPKGEAKKAKHVCWGNKTRDNLIRVGVDDDNAVILGCTTMDYLRTEFDSYYLSKDELWNKYGIDKGLETIIFISSFSNVNVSEETIKHMYAVMGKEKYDTFRDNSVKSQKAIVSWLLKLADMGYKVIYRPHPNEKLSEEITRIENDNFIVIGEYAVKQWIRYADYVFTWISTTYAECNIAGIPCGILNPYRYDSDDEMSIFENADKIDSFEKLISFMNSVKEEKIHETDEIIKRYFAREEIPAFIKTADYMQSLLKENEVFIWDDNMEKSFKERKTAEQIWVDKLLTNYEKYKAAEENGGVSKLLAGIYKKDYLYIKERLESKKAAESNALYKEKDIIRHKILMLLEKFNDK